MGLTLFILGDAVAALVGKAVGRIKVGSKTVEGALGCYLLCVALAAFLFPRLPAFLADWGGATQHLSNSGNLGSRFPS